MPCLCAVAHEALTVGTRPAPFRRDVRPPPLKPLGITVESCDNVLRVAYETGTRLYVGHDMRHMVVVRLMRDITARGDIGEPVPAASCPTGHRRHLADTSPVAARMGVAAGVLATRSLREGGVPYDVPALDPGLIAYFERGRVRR